MWRCRAYKKNWKNKEVIEPAGVVPERLQDKICGPVQKLELARTVKEMVQDKLVQ